jgi:hyperosmotically inducible periplasmic protein
MMNQSEPETWCRRPESLLEGTATNQGRPIMKYARALAFAVVVGATIVTATGCAVMRGQETTGAYIDDTSITTSVKAKFVEDKTVDAGAIKVETLNGTVQLSGFAKTSAEKAQAEKLARTAKGVKAVKNDLTVRP